MSTGFERLGNDSQLQDHWIRRLVAFIIDSILVSVVTFIITIIVWIPFILMAAATGLPWNLFNPFSFPFYSGMLSVLYFTLFETYSGSTFGKRIMSLKTTSLDGQRPSLRSAFIRNVSKIYWILVLVDVLIGLASSGSPRQKVTDRVAGTIVVSTSVSPLIRAASNQAGERFCPHCGQKSSADAKYCPYCGKEQS
jgi:uncharacterized RDD family membrane protein YckC